MAAAQTARTHCPQGHPYDEENTMHRSGNRRVCRTCKAERYRAAHPTVSLAEKLWQRIAPDRSGCWLWIGAIHAEGYGVFDDQLAHRLMYELIVGSIPEGFTIDHVRARGCGHRNCVNPSHLEPVTIAENVMRGDSLPAKNARKTHCPQGHPYDEENTWRSQAGWRQCRACNRERHRSPRR